MICADKRRICSRVTVNRLNTILIIVIEVKKTYRVNDREIVRVSIALEMKTIDRQPLSNLIYSITCA